MTGWLLSGYGPAGSSIWSRGFLLERQRSLGTDAVRAQQPEPIGSLGSDSDDRLVKQGLLTSPRNKLVRTLEREPCAVSQEGPDKGSCLWLAKVIPP